MRLHRRLLRFVGVTQVHPVYGETSAERLARVRSRRFPLLVVHALQLVLAIVLLGLDAYNIHYVAYNVLVYGLVAEICTIMIGLYLIIFRYKYPEAYSHVVRPFLNLWMLVFWIIALGLLASLAEHWQQPQCTYSFASGYECTSLPKKRPKIPHKRDTTTYTAYSAALIAGTVFSSFEVILWAITTGIAFLDAWKDRKYTPPPRPSPSQVEHAIARATPALHRTPLSEEWDTGILNATAHRAGPEPILPDDDDEDPHLLAPSPLRYIVTNQDHTPKSTPGFDVPHFHFDQQTRCSLTPPSVQSAQSARVDAQDARGPAAETQVHVSSAPQRRVSFARRSAG